MSVSFAGHELHSPRFALEEARELARELFAVEGAASELGSHQDQNVLIDGPSGRFVLKIANAAFGEAELDLQNRAMVHLAERLPIEVPQPCPARDGREIVAVERDGVTYLLRLVTFIEGEPLIDAPHLAPPVLRALGEVAGLVARALEDFEHPAADRAMQWDPRHVGAVVEALAPHVEDARRRALVSEVGARAAEAIERLAPQLRRQVAHCDVTDWNVIGRRDRAGRPMPCGVIDFGDVTRTLRACELAVAASIAYGHEPDDPICAAAEIVRGFDAVCPLDDAELEVLPHLIAARAAIVAVGTEQQAALEPHNAYAQRVRAGDWAICETAAAQPTLLVDALLRRACGRSAATLAPRVPRGRVAASGRRARSASSISRRPASIRSRRPAPSEPMPRRAGTRRASSRTTSRRRSTSASTCSRPRAARCARRSQVAWNTPAGVSSCSRPAAQRCVWRVSCPPWRWATASRPEPSSGASEQGPSCRRTCTSRSGRPD